MRGKATKFTGLSVKNNPKNKFRVVFCHYTADPDKRKIRWKQKHQEGISPDAWNQEYEINFTTRIGTPAFGNTYDSLVHAAKGDYVRGEVLYRGWDFGYLHPACVVAKINTSDQWHILKEWMGTDIVDADFWNMLLKEQKELYPNAEWWDFCDIAGLQHESGSEYTPIEKLNNLLGEFNSALTYQSMHPPDRIDLIRQMLLLRKDKKPGLLVDEELSPIITEAFAGGYLLGKRCDSQGRRYPEKDGWYEHLMEAFQYIIACMGIAKYMEARAQRYFNPYLMGDAKTGY